MWLVSTRLGEPAQSAHPFRSDCLSETGVLDRDGVRATVDLDRTGDPGQPVR